MLRNVLRNCMILKYVYISYSTESRGQRPWDTIKVLHARFCFSHSIDFNCCASYFRLSSCKLNKKNIKILFGMPSLSSIFMTEVKMKDLRQAWNVWVNACLVRVYTLCGGEFTPPPNSPPRPSYFRELAPGRSFLPPVFFSPASVVAASPSPLSKTRRTPPLPVQAQIDGQVSMMVRPPIVTRTKPLLVVARNDTAPVVGARIAPSRRILLILLPQTRQ